MDCLSSFFFVFFSVFSSSFFPWLLGEKCIVLFAAKRGRVSRSIGFDRSVRRTRSVQDERG